MAVWIEVLFEVKAARDSRNVVLDGDLDISTARGIRCGLRQIT